MLPLPLIRGRPSRRRNQTLGCVSTAHECRNVAYECQVSGRLTEALLPEKNGIKIKWMEPQEAAKPRKRWRLFPFKGQQALGMHIIFDVSLFDAFAFCTVAYRTAR